jgi:hypothetical protein
MAQITIVLGFMRTAEQEDDLRLMASRLPDDWTIEMSGDPVTHIFDVRVQGPDLKASKMFAPDGIESAINYLEAIRPECW